MKYANPYLYSCSISKVHTHTRIPCMVCLFLVESLESVTNGLVDDEEWAEIYCCLAANFEHYAMNFCVSRYGPDIVHTKVLRTLRRTCASVCCQGYEQVFRQGS
jgi:hypothetical protein